MVLLPVVFSSGFMTAKTYHRFNFHKHTFCVWQEVNESDLPQNKPDYTSRSGSSYFFTDEGVYRRANHWGRAANCKWRLLSLPEHEGRTKIGFAKWTDFYPDNELQKLYFITVDFQSRTVQYHHRNCPNFQANCFLRTAADTMKLVRTIRQLLSDNRWTAYYPNRNPEELERELINQLVDSGKSLQQIKKEWLAS